LVLVVADSESISVDESRGNYFRVFLSSAVEACFAVGFTDAGTFVVSAASKPAVESCTLPDMHRGGGGVFLWGKGAEA
jgi:hypothetical protein